MTTPSAPSIAIILAGCGRGDGTEITEAVSTLVHCSRRGLRVRCFSPDQESVDTINHATGQPMPGTRNLLVEAARISRGEISPISTLRAIDFDMLILPGGFGAAKYLCDFATKGPACVTHPQVTRVVTEFHSARKPMGFICIAPVIAARVLGAPGDAHCCQITLGTSPGPAQAVEAMGAKHVPLPSTACHVDAHHRIVSTPAYMHEDATPFEVFTGIGALVDALVTLHGSR